MSDLENYLNYAIDTVSAAHEKHNKTLLENGIGGNRRCVECGHDDGTYRDIKVNSLFNDMYTTSYCKQYVEQISNASYNNMSLDSTSHRFYYDYTPGDIYDSLESDSDEHYYSDSRYI
jgi:hypothetical protein